MSKWTRRRALRAALGAGLSSVGATLAPWRALAAEQKASALLRAPKRALVIGNSAYRVSPLANPANDARAMAAALKEIGFEVALALDLARAEMLAAARSYTDALERGKAVGLFYYAGHGMQLAWRNYLLPVDAVLKGPEDVPRACLDLNTVIEGISRAANPMNLIVLDACRENPFARDFRVEQKGLSQLDAPVDTLLAYATSPGNVASDGAGANGLYTENLLREMRVPEAKIEDVFKRVRLAVRRASSGAQVPWESTSLEDDFWFIPPIALKELSDAEAAREMKEELARQERLKAQREAEAAQARKDELAMRERLKGAPKAPDAEKLFEEEAAAWEQAAAANTPAAIEEYLWRYPSGNFTELAQLGLDELLAAQGEKKVEVVASAQNPYSKGFARADTDYKVGDAYTFATADAISKVVQRTDTITVTRVTARQVFYDSGQITDRLGNPIRFRGARHITNNQQHPAEFQLGRQWVTRYSGEHRTMGRFTAEMSMRIAARETISVGAGSFDTFRVDGSGVIFGGRVPQQVRTRAWYAPGKVRRFVLREEFRTGGRGQYSMAERTELKAFSQA